MYNGIIMQHKYDKGILSGPKRLEFDIIYDNTNFNICVEQCVIRKITVRSSQCLPLTKIWDTYLMLEMLLMLFDGFFIPVESGKVIYSDNEIDNSELVSLIEKRASFYKSADYLSGKHSKFCDYEKVLNSTVFAKWIEILKELDILHPMVLYAMADIELTIDCKCAFLIESFEALAELVADKNTNYTLPTVSRGESKLGRCLETIINLCGEDVFKKEFEKVDRKEFVSLLVNSRNRIAHIKSKQRKKVLDGRESILYAVKLSYLYRITLLTLLDIDYNRYVEGVKESIAQWDIWQGVLDSLLNKMSR